jgi:hypothetical protein
VIEFYALTIRAETVRTLWGVDPIGDDHRRWVKTPESFSIAAGKATSALVHPNARSGARFASAAPTM